MATYNSRKDGRRVFRASVRTAGIDPKSVLTIITRGGYTTHAEHASGAHFNAGANRAALHYIHGCKTCGAKPVTTPSPEATRLFGITKIDGRLHFPGDGCRPYHKSLIGTPQTAGAMLSFPVRTRGGVYGGQTGGQTLYEAFLQPDTLLGYDKNTGQEIVSGLSRGKGKSKRTSVARLINTARAAAASGYQQLLDRGETELEPYFQVAKDVSHLEHGKKLILPGDSGWEDLKPGERPLNTHWELNNFFKNAHDAIELAPASMTQAVKDMATTDFVGCHCPTCELNEGLYSTNRYFDVQHHSAAFNHEEPEIQAAFRCSQGGFPIGETPEIGRISDLGEQGKKTPHRNFWTHTKDALKYIHHQLNARRDLKRRDVTGVEAVVDPQTQIDPEALRARQEANLGTVGDEDYGL